MSLSSISLETTGIVREEPEPSLEQDQYLFLLDLLPRTSTLMKTTMMSLLPWDPMKKTRNKHQMQRMSGTEKQETVRVSLPDSAHNQSSGRLFVNRIVFYSLADTLLFLFSNRNKASFPHSQQHCLSGITRPELVTRGRNRKKVLLYIFNLEDDVFHLHLHLCSSLRDLCYIIIFASPYIVFYIPVRLMMDFVIGHL